MTVLWFHFVGFWFPYDNFGFSVGLNSEQTFLGINFSRLTLSILQVLLGTVLQISLVFCTGFCTATSLQTFLMIFLQFFLVWLLHWSLHIPSDLLTGISWQVSVSLGIFWHLSDGNCATFLHFVLLTLSHRKLSNSLHSVSTNWRQSSM